MIRIKYILLFALCLAPLAMWANGGGTYAISATVRSSNPIFREIKEVTLLSEKLYIKLNSGRADITVKYILVNNSGKDYTNLDYAFPVDRFDMEEITGGRDAGIKNIQFFVNDKPLPYNQSEDTSLGNEVINDADDTNWEIYGGEVVRRWFYTKVDIPKHSVVRLDVKYSLETLYLCDGDNPTNINYLDGCVGRFFAYDFSPAKYWGDGIIRDFYVEVDGSDLFFAEDIQIPYSPGWDEKSQSVKEKSYSPCNVRGLDFTQTGNRFEYRQRNFDLHKAKPLWISYTADEISSSDMISRFGITNDQYTVKVSSEQRQHPASNLSDMNLETAWVPSNKGGIGDWVEFTFKKPTTDIAGFGILNGYQKNEKTYLENNRVEEIKVEIKQTEREEYDDEWQEVYSGGCYGTPKYEQVYFENLSHHLSFVDFWDIVYSPEIPIEKIRITILKVSPGTKYNDTCISEIIFLKNRTYEWNSEN